MGGGALPWALALLPAPLPGARVGFARTCHQLPERSLVLLSTMPVCSRCAGLYAGVALGAILPWPRGARRHARAALLGAALAMCLDVWTQDVGLHPPWHATRLATGALLGWIGSGLLLRALLDEAENRRLAHSSSSSAPAP
jgi:uncharacterized membrane protein